MDPEEEELMLKAKANLALQQQPPSSEQPPGVMGAIGTGLYHGAMNIAALPGNLDEFARMVGHYAAEKISGRTLPMPPRLLAGIAPTGPELEGQIAKDTGFSPAEAAPGSGAKVAEDVASFVPGALTMPAKSAGELAMNVGKYALTPYATGKAAETGAALVGASPETQQIAGAAGQMVGTGLGILKDRPALTAANTLDDVKADVSHFYDAARAKGVVYKPEAVDKLVRSIEVDADKMGANPGNFPGSTDALVIMQNKVGKPVDLQELDLFRQQINDVQKYAARTGNGNDMRMATMMKKKIDDFVNSEDVNKIQAGDTSGLADLLRQGRAARLRQDKMEIIQDAMRNADLSAVGQKGDMDTALSNEFRRIAKSDDFGKFTPEEQAAIEEVVRKSRTERVGAFLEQFADPRRPRTALIGSGVGAAAAMGVGVPWAVGAAIPPALGMAGRAIAQGVTERQAKTAADLIAGGAYRPPWNALKRGYIPLAVPLGNMATQPPGNP